MTPIPPPPKPSPIHEPSNQFCQLISELPELDQLQALELCGAAIGFQREFEQYIKVENPLAERCRPPSIKELGNRIYWLIEIEHMAPTFLIPALVHHITEFYRQISEVSATSRAIDHDLDYLKQMEAYRDTPSDQRPPLITDRFIGETIARIKAGMPERAAQTKLAQQTAPLVAELVKKHFPEDYWLKWRKRVASY